MSKVKVVVSFSGGKDSQACLIWAVKKYGNKNIEAVFCDTGWEHPITVKHVHHICKKMGIKLTVLKNGSFEELVMKKGFFPFPKQRICTFELKVKPMIDWMLSQDSSFIIIQGIRSDESETRSKMLSECNYFGEYYIKSNKNLHRKRDVLKWCESHDASVRRPIFDWSAQKVINYILDTGQEPCELYKRGSARVGCYPCIMARQAEIRMLAKDKEMTNRLINLEQELNKTTRKGKSTFFAKGFIPERFCRQYGYGCPSVREVIDYVSRYDNLPKLFKFEEMSCVSMYHGLCE